MGVSLYFKFIKSVFSMIFLMLLLNGILFFIYYRGKQCSQNFNIPVYTDSGEDGIFSGAGVRTFSLTLRSFWTSISLGGFAASSNRFFEKELSDVPQYLELSCPKGFISLEPSVTYFGLISPTSNAIYTMFQIDKRCNNNDAFAEAVKNCENLSKCDILYSNSWFDPECLKDNESNKLYLKIYCARSSLRIFNRDFTKEQFSWVVFLANILTLISLLIFLLNQKVTEKKLVKYHEKERATPSNYSL